MLSTRYLSPESVTPSQPNSHGLCDDVTVLSAVDPFNMEGER